MLKTKNIYSVVIIGAGPAGIAVAMELNKYNISYLVVDKSSFPREKICGDAIATDTLEILKEYQLNSEVEKLGYPLKQLIRYADTKTPLKFNTNAVILKREIFDTILFKKILKDDQFLKATFTGTIGYNGTYHEIELKRNQGNTPFYIYGKYVILATGCQDSLALSHLNKFCRIAKPDQIAFRGYCRYEKSWLVQIYIG